MRTFWANNCTFNSESSKAFFSDKMRHVLALDRCVSSKCLNVCIFAKFEHEGQENAISIYYNSTIPPDWKAREQGVCFIHVQCEILGLSQQKRTHHQVSCSGQSKPGNSWSHNQRHVRSLIETMKVGSEKLKVKIAEGHSGLRFWTSRI